MQAIGYKVITLEGRRHYLIGVRLQPMQGESKLECPFFGKFGVPLSPPNYKVNMGGGSDDYILYKIPYL